MTYYLIMASDKTDVVELKKLNARCMAAADGAIRDKHELDNALAVDLAEAIKPVSVCRRLYS